MLVVAGVMVVMVVMEVVMMGVVMEAVVGCVETISRLTISDKCFAFHKLSHVNLNSFSICIAPYLLGLIKWHEDLWYFK